MAPESEISAGGEVMATSDADFGRSVELALWIDGPRGRTVTGAATVAIAR